MERHQQVALIERPVALQDQNTLLVRLASGPGGTIAVSIGSDVPCLEVRIKEPPDGATVNETLVRVRGTVQAPGEVGVVVNGVLAQVNGPDFVAEAVPLQPGSNPLTAIATEPEGNTATASVTVLVSPTATEPSVILTASPASGLRPLDVGFALASLVPRAITSVTLDFGDSSPPFTGTSLDGVRHTYTAERLYLPTVTVTDASGAQTIASAVVNVFPLPDLVAKWNGMKAALRRSDISAALQFISPVARGAYGAMFAGLGGQLSNIDALLADITLVAVRGNRAEFKMRRVDQGIVISHFVLFVRDADGIWRLKFF